MEISTQNDRRKCGKIEPFVYPSTAFAESFSYGIGSADGQSGSERCETSDAVDEIKQCAAMEARIAEETRRAFEAGRDCGRQEGRQAERESQATLQRSAEEMRARQGTELIASFAQERDRYLHEVEHEIVRLALAIAARILRREAQMDPLLLTGAVRVALGQLAGTTEVKLRVPAPDLELWKEAIAHVPNLAAKPAVIVGEGMRVGECVIETALGSVDLGIRSQLGEIERGFFDRAHRTGSGAAANGEATRAEGN
jgi:flagellar assembly protein FliH